MVDTPERVVQRDCNCSSEIRTVHVVPLTVQVVGIMVVLLPIQGSNKECPGPCAVATTEKNPETVYESDSDSSIQETRDMECTTFNQQIQEARELNQITKSTTKFGAISILQRPTTKVAGMKKLIRSQACTAPKNNSERLHLHNSNRFSAVINERELSGFFFSLSFFFQIRVKTKGVPKII